MIYDAEIKIDMASGNTMSVYAAAVVVKDSQGYYISAFKCFWPGKGKDRIIPENLYNVSGAQDAFLTEVEKQR
jgi:hypothetical protein